MNKNPWKIWIDTGGTFTDCIAFNPEGTMKRLKVLSHGVLRLAIKEITGPKSLIVDFPLSFSTGFLTGFHASLNGVSCRIKRLNPLTSEIHLDKKIKTGADTIEITTYEEVPVFAIRLLTETGIDQPFPETDFKLGSTRGTNALLERKGARTAFLVTRGFKDLLLIKTQQRPDLFALNIKKEQPLYDTVLEISERIAADGSVLQTISPEEIKKLSLVLKQKKIESIAIALLNSYRNPMHEKKLKDMLASFGFNFISCSHELSSQIKIVPRAETSVINAYLDPIINQYIRKIRNGLGSASFSIMSSSGGLLNAGNFKPKDSLLSGPAGGVVGALKKAQQSGINNIISFDMGGTSTDVSLCHGRPAYRFESSVGMLNVLSPSIAIETIAAGGGSICGSNESKLTVGPHSAGATPGPACYGAGGPLTITDVNLLLGRLDEESFSIPLRQDQAEKKFLGISAAVKVVGKSSAEGILISFIRIANEKMAEAIKKVSVQQGHDTKEYSLLCFGGAGGQHACSLASMLGIPKIIVPYDAGLLSAYGIGHSSPEKTKEKLLLKDLSDLLGELSSIFLQLETEALEELKKDNATIDSVTVKGRLIFLRLKGQETSLEIEYTEVSLIKPYFVAKYKKVYGHWIEGRGIEVESVRIIVSGTNEVSGGPGTKAKKHKAVPIKKKKIFTTKWEQCPAYRWEYLAPGACIDGPALLTSNNSTLFIEPGWDLFIDENENAIVSQSPSKLFKSNTTRSYIAAAELELFTNRFTAIAQTMGALLQRTSFSVNVKERLDFSCALLDANGFLIVNAPHIPVHLGSLGVCVRELIKRISMKPGDVVITNHPAYGGSHLPDVTLVKPVYYKNKLIGFAANRAHHAEIGGKKPGSMPADGTSLEEEGVVINPTFLVRKHVAQWKNIEKLFSAATYPTRSLHENLSDLNGALASLIAGEEALINLVENYGLNPVIEYMEKLKKFAGSLLKKQLEILPTKIIRAVEHLDDGAVLQVRIQRSNKKLTIDFNGSSAVHEGNMNATKAIVQSVVLYVLRILVNKNIPLNEGLLEPVKVIVPKGILNPEFKADNRKSPAVVGGNTEVSQRLTDLLLKAFSLAACSQGTMNNFLFGNDSFGYYETICGGTGAGKGFHGADAVHQHMTNTRITDPEIIEHRYPVQLVQFSIRKDSGGKGKWHGGNGVVREFLFKEPFEINILSQHRIQQPYGAAGGKPGKTGEQFLVRSTGKKLKLKGIDGISVQPGDRIIIKTPGGGGWGKP